MIVRVLAVVAAVLMCSGTADAAWNKRHYKPAVSTTAARLPPGQIYPNRPAWAPPSICFTDEGYGRFLECGMGGKGG